MLNAVQIADPDAALAAIDAAWEAGQAALPLDPALPPPARAELLDRLRPHRLIDEHGATDLPDPTPVPSDTALAVTTSGSTGRPRGILLSSVTLDAAVAASRARLGAADGTPWLGVLPLHHVAGVSVVLRSRAAGATPQLHQRDTPGALADAPASWISLVPAQLRRLLDADVDLARHAGVLLGGAAAPPGLLDRARTSGVRVAASYGSTETCGGCVYDGAPLAGVEVRLAEADGAIALRGPMIDPLEHRTDGAHRRLVDADGWLRTADAGRLTPHGRLEVLGRLDDVVVSGGENIPLPPVRRALAALPWIRQAAVVGLPDETWGTAVTAVVVAEGGRPTLDDVRTALRGTLVSQHLPTQLVVVDALPRDPMGKVTPAAVDAARTNARA